MTSAVSPHQAMHYGMGLIAPCRAIEIDLANPLQDLVVGAEFRGVLALVTDRGEPVGNIILPVREGTVTAVEVIRTVHRKLGTAWLRLLVRRRLEAPLPLLGIDHVDDLRDAPPGEPPAPLTASIVVCTRDRTEHLERCLRALAAQQHVDHEILVVDNAPTDDSVRQLVQGFPSIRYVAEPRPGLSIARNRGIAESRGEVIAFTDDDAVPEADWLSRLLIPFSLDPQVGIVTGLTTPLSLDTEPQVMSEMHRSFDRGYHRLWLRVNPAMTPPDTSHYRAYRFGAGVNMAIRRDVFDRCGTFDETLGAGSRHHAGEDTELFFRALEAEYTLVYEPVARVRHAHRASWQALARQWTGWTDGHVTSLVRLARRGYRHAWRLWRFTLGYVLHTQLAWLKSLLHPRSMPSALLRGEALGALRGLANAFRPMASSPPVPRCNRPAHHPVVAVRQLNLATPLTGFDDVTTADATWVHVSLGNRMLGTITIDNRRSPIGRAWLLDELASQLSMRMLADSDLVPESELKDRFLDQLLPVRTSNDTTRPANPHERTLSVVIATRDRPELLGECLDSLARQDTALPLEVVVVDNHPESGLTRPVVEGRDGVVLLEEREGGASAARNRGLRASHGEFIALIDDDVVVPPHWANMVLRSFARSDVAVVTGAVMARSLTHRSQYRFETNYGFVRGFDIAEFGPKFFEADPWQAPPVSHMGAGAMICVRRAVLDESGLFLETIGPGTPARAGEDLYFLYALSKTSWTLMYSPHVYGLHTHRAEEGALRRQIFNYGVGYYAHLTATLLRDGDLRAAYTMMVRYPLAHLQRLLFNRQRSNLLTLLEWAGNAYGPFAYLVSVSRAAWRRRQTGAVVTADATEREAAALPPPADGKRRSG